MKRLKRFEMVEKVEKVKGPKGETSGPLATLPVIDKMCKEIKFYEW